MLFYQRGTLIGLGFHSITDWNGDTGNTSCQYVLGVAILDELYVTQRKLMRLFEGDIKTDILNSTYCSISMEHFDIKTIFISYSFQKL